MREKRHTLQRYHTPIRIYLEIFYVAVLLHSRAAADRFPVLPARRAPPLSALSVASNRSHDFVLFRRTRTPRKTASQKAGCKSSIATAYISK